MISEERAREILIEKLKILFKEGQEEEIKLLNKLELMGQSIKKRTIQEQFNVEKDIHIGVAPLRSEKAWVFSYQDKRFLETKDINYALTENYPILIGKNEEVFILGESMPPEDYLKLYDNGDITKANDVKKL